MLQSHVSCSLHIANNQLVKGQKVSSSKNIKKQKQLHFLYTNQRRYAPVGFPKQLLYFISVLTSSAVPTVGVLGVCKNTGARACVAQETELAHPSSGLVGMKKS
jgi:hypothetical protein